MTPNRLFLDTVFIQALLNRRDKYHAWATALLPTLQQAGEVWITEAVLTEVGNALAATNRQGAAAFIRQCYVTPNIHIVSIDSDLLHRALDFFASHRDKAWGLTDCLSFVVMADRQLTVAATADHHFRQAGFEILYL